ncbi:class I SAM-dependent methyltransferase [Nonomuraea ferruginea]
MTRSPKPSAPGSSSWWCSGPGWTPGPAELTPPGGRAYELDLPVNVASKRQGLRALPGGVPERVRLIEVDFETAELADVLTTALAVHGFEADRPSGVRVGGGHAVPERRGRARRLGVSVPGGPGKPSAVHLRAGRLPAQRRPRGGGAA